jgi:hypothetical protein
MRLIRLVLLAALAWVVNLVWVLTPLGDLYATGTLGTIWRLLPALVFVAVLGWVFFDLLRWRRRLGITRARRGATPADVAADIQRASRRTRR